jgi:hypothetical protein
MSDVPTRQLVDETTQRVLQLLQQSGVLNDAKIDGAIIGRAKLQFTNISCTLRFYLLILVGTEQDCCSPSGWTGVIFEGIPAAIGKAEAAGSYKKAQRRGFRF